MDQQSAEQGSKESLENVRKSVEQLSLYFQPPSPPFIEPITYDNIQIIFDIDDTLVVEGSKLSEYEQNRFKQNEIRFKLTDSKGRSERHYYILLPGAIEMIQFIRKAMPNAVIAFFSAGIDKRNKALLKCLNKKVSITHDEKIILASRKHLFFDELFIDKEDSLFAVPSCDAHVRGKKNLSSIAVVDIKNTIIIDDNFNYACKDQQSNWLVVPSAKRFFSNNILRNINIIEGDGAYDEVNKMYTRELEYYEVNHLFYALGLLVSALEQAQQNKQSLIVALNNLQTSIVKDVKYFRHSLHLALNQKYPDKYYLKGELLIQKINPSVTSILPFPYLEIPKSESAIIPQAQANWQAAQKSNFINEAENTDSKRLTKNTDMLGFV